MSDKAYATVAPQQVSHVRRCKVTFPFPIEQITDRAIAFEIPTENGSIFDQRVLDEALRGLPLCDQDAIKEKLERTLTQEIIRASIQIS